MNNGSVLSCGAAVGFLLGLAWVTFPPPASAAVGDALLPGTITPAAAASCGNQGGTSVAIVQGSKLAGVDSLANPVLLAITCLDSLNVTKRSTVNFINLSSGAVVKSIQTKIAGVVAAPGNGWAHLVHRPDKGDLLGCGNDGTIYSIDYSQFTNAADGTAIGPLPRPNLPNSCGGLAWDPEEDRIYQGLTTGPGKVDIVSFKDGTTATLTTVNTPATCTPSGLAITGGALVVACDGSSTILRFNKNPDNTGALPLLSPNGTLSVGAGVLPDLGDLACDPVTFSGRFRDAMWSRNGVNGNGVVALEFPPFTCGLPSNATVLWAGLSAPSGGVKPACFDAGNVKDLDGDDLPDCWEDGSLWADGKPGIDFDGNGIRDVVLCVQVDTNGDGIPDSTECADKNFKDLFVEVDWMQDHKPDPLALSQSQSVASVGVQSIREAFAAAPVPVCDPSNLSCTSMALGIRLHIQVDEQVSFTTFANPPTTATHVTELVFTPCTPPAITINSNGTTTQNVKSLSDSADFDVIKKANFGTATERASGANTLNAKRLAFRYVLFGHSLTGTNGGGSNGSGCSEVAGDDAAVTLGSFLPATTVGGVSHNRGNTDQQAGTFMHEFGHTLGLQHGGRDKFNCKPNYLSVMSYSRQFTGSPIQNRRLDYSSASLPTLNEGVLNAGLLNELIGLGGDLGPEPPFFPSADQTAFGPDSWAVVTATGVACTGGTNCINWNRSKSGQNPSYQNNAFADINKGPLGTGCDVNDSGTSLVGHDDWNNLLYRASAALDFAGGVHTATSQEHVSITSDQESQMFGTVDLDDNGVFDTLDCGTFLCSHRIDVKPSFPVPKQISQGSDSTITVVIFSEKGGPVDPVDPVWNAAVQVHQDTTLKLNGISVKVNHNGEGTCSESDIADPDTGIKDGINDLKCQFPTAALHLGTQWGIVTGVFDVNDGTGALGDFMARQLINVTQ